MSTLDMLDQVDRKISRLKEKSQVAKTAYDATCEKMDAENIEQRLDELKQQIRIYKNTSEPGATSKLKRIYRLHNEARTVKKKYDLKLDQLSQEIMEIDSSLEELRALRTVLYARAHGSLLKEEWENMWKEDKNVSIR